MVFPHHTRATLDVSLNLVTDTALCAPRDLFWVVLQAVRGGVTLVQLREKQANTRDFVQLGRKLKSALNPFSVPLLINDRVDVALACGADGVHLGQTDLHYNDARKILGPQSYIGVSIETEAQAKEAQGWDVDYIAVSPVFSTQTKVDTVAPWGLQRLAQLAQGARHPVVAIGGIDSKNAQSIFRAGAKGVAVVSAICAASDPKAAARAIQLQKESFHEHFTAR